MGVSPNVDVVSVCRPRMSEMSFVLKAASTLLITLKRAPPANGELSLSRVYTAVISVISHCNKFVTIRTMLTCTLRVQHNFGL